MSMFSNVSSQVSGLGSSLGSWFKKGEGEENKDPAKETTSPQEQPSPASANASEQSVKGSADGENEDAASQHSGATEGADSHPASEGEEETTEEGKGGFASAVDDVSKAWEGLSFNLSGVSSRASAGAKSVGSFFSSAFSKAGASVKEAGSKIKETVEKNMI